MQLCGSCNLKMRVWKLDVSRMPCSLPFCPSTSVQLIHLLLSIWFWVHSGHWGSHMLWRRSMKVALPKKTRSNSDSNGRWCAMSCFFFQGRCSHLERTNHNWQQQMLWHCSLRLVNWHSKNSKETGLLCRSKEREQGRKKQIFGTPHKQQ